MSCCSHLALSFSSSRLATKRFTGVSDRQLHSQKPPGVTCVEEDYQNGTHSNVSMSWEWAEVLAGRLVGTEASSWVSTLRSLSWPYLFECKEE